MSIDNDFFGAWSRLSATDLQIVRFVCSQIDLIRVSPELCGYLGAMCENEMEHRSDLRVKPPHPGTWRSLDNGRLAKAYTAAYGIRRASIQSNTIAEWAALLVDCVCDEMAARLQVSQQLADAENN